MLSTDMQFMLDEEKLPFLTMNANFDQPRHITRKRPWKKMAPVSTQCSQTIMVALWRLVSSSWCYFHPGVLGTKIKSLIFLGNAGWPQIQPDIEPVHRIIPDHARPANWKNLAWHPGMCERSLRL